MRASGGKMKALDLLKSTLAERQAKAQKIISDAGGQKWVRRGELEAKRKEEYLEQQREEEEKRQADEEAHMRRLEEHLTSRKPEDEEEEKAIPQHILNEALLADDDAEPPIPVSEILERLREIAQPITLFGETDMVRYRRLRNCEKEIHEGKKNPDLVMLENVHVGQQMDALKNDLREDEEDKDNEEEEDDADSDKNAAKGQDKDDSDKSDSEDEAAAPAGDGDKSDSEDEGDTTAQQQRAADMVAAAEQARQALAGGEVADTLPDVDVKLMDRCDFIRAWARKSLKAWEKELADKPEDEKKTAKCKTEVAQHRQVRRDVRPLQKRLRLYKMEDFLLEKIHGIVKCAADREYRQASEAYLDLSIGKAAWPVGLGCGGSMLMEDAIGLHDRFNRMNQVKDIAYALNDEVTRKFVQALKRLMSVAQRYWPPDDPSKAA